MPALKAAGQPAWLQALEMRVPQLADSQVRASLALVLWCVAALVIIVAPFFFFTALGSAAKRSEAQAVDVLQAELAPIIAQRSIPEPVIAKVSSIIDRKALAVNYLTLRNADRVILVSDGSLQKSLGWLSAKDARGWRNVIYGLVSFDRSLTLRHNDEVVGYAEYGIATRAVLAALSLRAWLLALAFVLAFYVVLKLSPLAVHALRARFGHRPATAENSQPRSREPAVARQAKAGVSEFDLGDRLGIGYLSVDAKAKVLQANVNAARILGFEVGRLPGQDINSLLVIEDDAQARMHSPLAQCLEGSHKSSKTKAWFRRRDGKRIGLEMQAAQVDTNGAVAASMLFWENSEDMLARRDNTDRLTLAQSLLQQVDEAVLLVDAQGRVVQANSAACDLFDYPLEKLNTQNIDALLPPAIVESGLAGLERVSTQVLCSHSAGEAVTLSSVSARWQGEPATMLILYRQSVSTPEPVAAPLSNDSATQLAAALPAMGYRDALTGLSNRRRLSERLASCFAHESTPAPCMLLLVDIRNFKQMNIEYGRDIADRALARFAQNLASSAVDANCVVRLGGDEFAVLFRDDKLDADRAQTLAKKLLQANSQPLHVGELDLEISLDIGMSLAPLDASTPSELMHHAEVALYNAKSYNQQLPVLYAPESQPVATATAPVARALHRAMATNEIAIKLRPIYPLGGTGAIAGAFATLSWVPPAAQSKGKKSAVTPLREAAIWEQAQACDLALQLAAWCVRGLAKEHGEWRSMGLSHLPLFLALPYALLQTPELARAITYVTQRYHLPPGSLVFCLEGESVKQEHVVPDGVRTALNTTLDTAAPTSAQFLWLPADLLAALPADSDAIELIKRLRSYARKNAKAIVAGPVETEAQKSALTALDVAYGYGPFLGEAMAPRAFARMLAKRGARAI